MALDREEVIHALKAVVSELDYDIYKSIENPEDPDDEDNYTWEDLAEIFEEHFE